MAIKEYYICSEDVVKHMKPTEVSLPVIMYPGDDVFEDKVYVAVLDFPAVQAKYKELGDDDFHLLNEDIDFWCEQLVPGQMNVNGICMDMFEKESPWEVILDQLGLSKMNNRAMTMCNLMERERMDPIEFWNKIANFKKS